MKGHNYGLCRKCGKVHIHPKGMLGKHFKPETIELLKQRRRGKGFSGRHHTPEAKKLIGQKARGRRIHFSDEHRRNIGLSRLGISPVNKGKKLENEETREKIRLGRLGIPSWNKGKLYPQISGNRNPAKRPEVKAKISKSLKGVPKSTQHKINLSISLKVVKREFYKLHPEKHPNYILAHQKNPKVSQPQLQMFELLKLVYPDAELNYPIRTQEGNRFADVGCPSKRLVFEYDEPIWHNPKDDTLRTKELEEVGWDVISFTTIGEVRGWMETTGQRRLL